MSKTRWSEVTYQGSANDTKFQRRGRLVAWKEGKISMQVYGAHVEAGEESGWGQIEPTDVDWRGCIRLHGAGEDARTSSVLMRVSLGERELLERAALAERMALTTWVRATALASARLALQEPSLEQAVRDG